MIGEALARELGRVASALEADDPVAGLPAAQAASLLCATAQSQGARLTPEQLAALQTLLARGQASVERNQLRLRRALESHASARRARAAYHDR